MAEHPLPEAVPIEALAQLLGLSSRQARNLLAEAGVQPVSRGRWPLAPAARALFAKAREARGTNHLAAARVEAIKAATARTALQTAREARDLIPVEDARLALDVLTGVVREELDSLPRRLARDRLDLARTERECRAALERIAAALERQARACQTGAFEEDHHDDAG